MKLWTPHRHYKVIAILFLLACISAALISSQYLIAPVHNVYNLENCWKISFNNNTLSSASLTDSGIGNVGYGDVVTMKTTLPDFGLNYPCGSMHSIHAILDVYVGKEHVYSFGRDYVDKGKTVPRHANYFPLGNDCAGKELLIVITGSKKNSFSGLSPVVVAERDDLFRATVTHMRYNIVIGAFLIAMGVVLMILSPYMIIYQNNDLRLFFSGLISLLLGLYTYSYYGIIDMLSGNSDLNTVCEYSSLYNIPTAILGYLANVYSGKLKKMFKALFTINVCVFLFVFMMTVFRESRIYEFTPLLHIMAAVEGILSLVVISYVYIKNHDIHAKHTINSDNAFSLGLIFFIVLSLVDIVRYNISKYGNGRGESYSTINCFLAGSLIFVSGLLVSYLLYIIYNSNLDSMQSRITSLAYTDPLTGLANRARCEQVMEMLSQEHVSYTIISMDLNKLKYVNDTLGHHEGDRLISGFATILSDCFIDANLVGRMGGDEFMIVLTEDRALNVTKRIHELYSMINDWNRKEQVFQYSASYGYAYSYEVPSGLAQEVYMLADSRMYEMKKEHQQNSERQVIKHA